MKHQWLVYTGPHADVEVPLDEPIGGYVIADNGKAVQLPEEVAAGLLAQGENSDPDGQHDRMWRTATAKEVKDAEKAAAAETDDADADAEPAAAAEGGEQ